MQKNLFFKLFIVGALMLLISVALMMIETTIRERMAYREQAVRSVANDSVREQTMIGPILVLPYTDDYDELETDEKKVLTRVARSVERRLLVFPNQMQLTGSIDTDRRSRGIHTVLVYSGQYKIGGDFVLPKPGAFTRANASSRLTLGKPFVAVSIEDVRGLRNLPQIQWNGKPVEFEQGSGLTMFKSGLHAPLDTFEPDGSKVPFVFELGLDGIERQHFVPIAHNNIFKIKSSWPHSQFSGRFLPATKDRSHDANGAIGVNWNISSLATNAQQQMLQIEGAGKQGELDSFNIGFIEPVNIYSQADRATKYGLLFVALTFAAFFMFEILKRLPIHPVQYLLVGLALALFFLLLVSLSEKISFALAYLAASAACLLLISYYLAHVLRNWRRGASFGLALTMLYGALYGLLNSESNALVLGSALLFAVLSAVMVATRKVDWYALGKGDVVANSVAKSAASA